MIGPPGSGKSMLAKRFCGILPKMTINEMLETTLIHSITQPPSKKTGLISKRPFRSPHHTTSDVALVGGGTYPKPGEVTLSHNGVLFLDELPEFNRNALESLRQPLEDHTVTIARANKTIQFPSKFQLIAAMNPTRNGTYTSKSHNDYFSRISGPLLDRIDLHIEVHNLPTKDILTNKQGEPTHLILSRTQKAHDLQKLRFKNTKTSNNACMSRKQLQQYCPLGESEKKLIECAIEEFNLSARAYDKIIKISRTIADLDKSDNITENHVAEAIQYRSLDRKYNE